MIRFGREIYKLSGSGNDFVFIDSREEPPGDLEQPAVVAAICARSTGVGADGVVFLESTDAAAYRIRYRNSDGSVAALCGNAVLCSARLAVELGIAHPDGFTVETDAGVLGARVRDDWPEIELAPPDRVENEAAGIALAAGEERVGFAMVGVPHLVVLCGDTAAADVSGRGRMLRSHPSMQAGANVNFVASGGAEWRIRTYERGVEAETLACGTGAVATAVLLAAWGLADRTLRFRTRSGYTLEVGLPAEAAGICPASKLTLRGSARVVFRGQLGEVALRSGTRAGWRG